MAAMLSPKVLGNAPNHSPASRKPVIPERLGVVLAYLACVAIWGTTWFAIRVCISPTGYPPFMAAALRAALATIIFAAVLPLGWLRPGPASVGKLIWTVAVGVFGSGGFALVYMAERWISGGLAAILNTTYPLILAVMATLTGTERVSRSAVFGSIIAMAGVFVIFHDRLAVSLNQALGVCMIVGSVALSAVNNVILKRHAHAQSPLASAAIITVVNLLILGICSAFVERRQLIWPPPLPATLAVAYLAILGTVVAFCAFFYLIKRVRLMTLTTLVFFPPMIALVVDALWERSCALSLASYAGMAITIGGVAFSVLSPGSDEN